MKDEAANNIFRSAMSLVEEELHKVRPNAVNLPRPDYLARNANYFRQKLRPQDPRGMDFLVSYL